MRSVPEASSSFNATGLETLGLPGHAKGLLGLWLVFTRTHDPVLVLFLLFCQDLDLTRRHAGVVGGGAKLVRCFVSESKRCLAA